jgi:predicted nucleotidyltransferase
MNDDDAKGSAQRANLANAVVESLREAVRGSASGLRGSLARGTSDRFSDIDVFWELPDGAFQDAIDELPETLAAVGSIDSIRSDPLLQNSEKRQLIYVQFSDVPLYWRVDIEVFAESIERDSSYDLDNPRARGDDWSLTQSALMNGVAALKALMRGDAEGAAESLGRAFARVDLPVPEQSLWDQIDTLTEVVGRIDLDQAELARRLQLHCRDALLERGLSC